MKVKQIVTLFLIVTSFHGLAGHKTMPTKSKKIALKIKEINLLSENGNNVVGDIELKSLISVDPNILKFEIDPLKNKREVGYVLYSVNPPTTVFSPTSPNFNAQLEPNGDVTNSHIDISGIPNGDYKLFLKIILKKKKKEEIAWASISINIQLQEYIDGDLVPPNPGPASEATLLGIDSDSDGVRDDVEIWINEKGLPSEQRASLIIFAKKMQERALNSQNRETSNVLTRRILDYDYCIKTRFTTAEEKALFPAMKIEQFNTKARLIEWARTQAHFGGKEVILDTNESNWPSYCEE